MKFLNNSVIKVARQNLDGSLGYLRERANEWANKYGSVFIGTEHILLAILGDERNKAYRLLEDLGVDTIRLEVELRKRLPNNGGRLGEGPLPASPVVENIFVHAHAYAAKARSRTNTGYVLYSMLTYGGFRHRMIGQEVLVNAGLNAGTLESLIGNGR